MPVKSVHPVGSAAATPAFVPRPNGCPLSFGQREQPLEVAHDIAANRERHGRRDERDAAGAEQPAWRVWTAHDAKSSMGAVRKVQRSPAGCIGGHNVHLILRRALRWLEPRMRSPPRINTLGSRLESVALPVLDVGPHRSCQPRRFVMAAVLSTRGTRSDPPRPNACRCPPRVRESIGLTHRPY